MHRVSGCPILKFLELFCICFGAGNEVEKIPFFRLVLEFRIFDNELLGYSICGCPLFGSPLCDQILFQFCQRQP